MFMLLSPDGIGKDKIYNGRKDHEDHKKTGGFIKEIKGEKAENISSSFEVIPESIIESDEDRKKENKEPVVEQQRLIRH